MVPKEKIKRKFDFKLSEFKISKKVKKTKTNKETGASNVNTNCKVTKESENKQTQLEPEMETADKKIALTDKKGGTTVTNDELIEQIQTLAAKGIFMEHVLSKALRSVPPVQRDGKLRRKLNLTTITTPKTSDAITDKSAQGLEENDAETSTILQVLEENLKNAVKPDAQALQGLTKKMSGKRNAQFAQRSLSIAVASPLPGWRGSGSRYRSSSYASVRDTQWRCVHTCRSCNTQCWSCHDPSFGSSSRCWCGSGSHGICVPFCRTSNIPYRPSPGPCD